MSDKQDIKLKKSLKRIPPNGGVFLPFGTYYFIKNCDQQCHIPQCPLGSRSSSFYFESTE